MSEAAVPSALAHLTFNNLPQGWIWTPLAPLIEKIEAGKSFQCEERPPAPDEYGVVKVSAVTWGTYNEAESKTVIDPDRVKPAYLVQTGDFLFSRANTIQLVGACVIAGSTTRRLMLSDKILRLVFTCDVKNWVLWFLRSSLGRKQIEALSTGNQESMRNIGQRRIAEIRIPLPPPAVRSSIQSKIDELFSRIDEGEQALRQVEKLVERYRQSVLKAAVTGELTRDWRETRKRAGEPVESGAALLARILKARRAAWEAAELKKMQAKGKTPTDDRWKQKYKEPEPPDTADLPELPKGWVWASIEQLVSEFGNGLSRKPAESPPGLPILRISAVRLMSVDASDVRYYVQKIGEVMNGFKVLKGDLLFTRYNGSKALVGVSGVYDADAPVLHPDKLIKARVVDRELVLPSFLAIACNAGEGWKHISSWVKTSAGQHGIAGSDIKRTPIPLPPRVEQERVSASVERCTESSASMRAAGAAEARRSAALRQSILKAAFSGQLVPQDPNDEPAEKLLERIAAGRAVAAPVSRKRTKNTA